jgi:hypothetical protein
MSITAWDIRDQFVIIVIRGRQEGHWTFLYIYYSSMCSFLLGQESRAAENKSMSITAWDIRDQFVIIVSGG